VRWNVGRLESTTRLRTFIPNRLSWNDPAKNSLGPACRLRTGVGRFRSCLYKLLVASSAACECGAEEQTVDHVVLQCPIHRPPLGLHGLTVLDDETIEWLLNICPEIKCCLAVPERTGSNDEAACCCVLCKHSNLNQPRCAVFCVLKKLIIKT